MSGTIERKLIQAGVKNLREFGYPKANDENILTDIVYSGFFKSMLDDNKGQGVDVEIDSLLAKIKEAR
tara:strand:- start:77 stop:280 length:204 start_codon:yes stop_codon:yes gene_type:complete